MIPYYPQKVKRNTHLFCDFMQCTVLQDNADVAKEPGLKSKSTRLSSHVPHFSFKTAPLGSPRSEVVLSTKTLPLHISIRSKSRTSVLCHAVCKKDVIHLTSRFRDSFPSRGSLNIKSFSPLRERPNAEHSKNPTQSA